MSWSKHPAIFFNNAQRPRPPTPCRGRDPSGESFEFLENFRRVIPWPECLAQGPQNCTQQPCPRLPPCSQAKFRPLLGVCRIAVLGSKISQNAGQLAGSRDSQQPGPEDGHKILGTRSNSQLAICWRHSRAILFPTNHGRSNCPFYVPGF